ncbi:MAG TPA: tripartite tricarboxylate transporter substrate binding protein [Alicycliphilus sp.]|nr:tripartite tricarboxylate transporter substrate binding protein [Alicycliphilus sp.]
MQFFKWFVAAGAIALSANVLAQERILVPYPAGGPSDATARVVANSLNSQGKSFIVENVGGATGLLAINKFLVNPKDQIFQGTQNELILPVLLNKAVKFKSEEFVPVQYVTQTYLVLVVRKGLGVKNFDEFLELAKSRKDNPLSYGTVGVGSLYHVMGEYLAKKKGVPLNHIPYKGGAPAMQDLIGGQIDFSITPYQTTFDDMAAKGMFQIIGIFSNDKPPSLSKLQSASSVEGLSDFNFSSYAGYFLKRNASDADKKKYNALFATVLNDENVKKSLSADGRRVLTPGSLKAADVMYMEEIARYKKLLETVGHINLE